jgi:hypothetical protein
MPPKPASAGSSLRRIVVSGAQDYDATKSLPHFGAGSPRWFTSTLYQRSQILTHHVLPDAGIHASKCESNQRCA